MSGPRRAGRLARASALASIASVVGCGSVEPLAVNATLPPSSRGAAEASADAVEPLPPLADRDASPDVVVLGSKRFEDPYTHFEDPSDARAAAWAVAQDAFARDLLARLPAREEVLKSLAAGHYPRRPLWVARGGARTFFSWWTRPSYHLTVMTPGQGARELPFSDVRAKSPPVIFPNRRGDRIAVTFGEDKDHGELRVIDVDSGKTIDSLPIYVSGGVRWSESDGVFFYCITDPAKPNAWPQIFRHVIGERSSADRLVFGGDTAATKLLKSDVATGSLQFGVGKRTFFVEIDLPPKAGATRAEVDAGPSPKTILVSPIGPNATPSPTFRAIKTKGYGFGGVRDDDLVVLGTWPEAGMVTYARADASRPDAAPTKIGGELPSPRAFFNCIDANYLPVGDRELVRLSISGATERSTLPAPFPEVSATPGVAGILIRLADPVAGGWYAVGAGGKPERLPLDPPQPTLDDVVAERLAFRDGVAALELVVVRPASARPDRSHPAELMMSTAEAPHGEMQTWFAHGGVLALCPLVAPAAGVSRRAVRQAERTRVRACADALVASSWTRPSRIGLIAPGWQAYAVLGAAVDAPTLFGAISIEDGFVDESITVPGARSHPRIAAELDRSVPYLEIGATPLPPVLVGGHGAMAGALVEGAKLVARLNAVDPKRLAALYRLPRTDPPGDDRAAVDARWAATEADEEAFLLWALAGEGRDRIPQFVRR